MTHKTLPGETKREAPPFRAASLNAQLASLAARQHGVLTTARLGLTSGGITKRLRNGSLHRVHRGVYAVGHPRLSEKGMYMAAVLAAGEGAALAGESAAKLWKAWRRAVRETHVVVEGHRRQRAGFRLHTTRHLDPRDVTVHDGIPVTTMARTLVDLAEQHLTNVIHEAAVQRSGDAGGDGERERARMANARAGDHGARDRQRGHAA